MLTRRIIPCLDIKNGRTVKGVKFKNLRDAGDPVELACRYRDEGADEIVFLDISATLESRRTVQELSRRVARELNIPFTIGGGISSVEEAGQLLYSGADKVSINTAAVRLPELIGDLANAFGRQFVVVAIDTRMVRGQPRVCTHAGQTLTDYSTAMWAQEVVSRGAGEILLTSMDRDGTKEGFDLHLLSQLSAELQIPLIASGGAGTIQDFVDVFTKTRSDGALAASVFHNDEIKIGELKSHLSNRNIPVRI